MQKMASLILLFAFQLAARSEQPAGKDQAAVEKYINQLSSVSFRERHEATQALQALPEAEPILRKSLSATDLETRRRIEEILHHIAQRPLRDLQSAVDTGRIDHAIDLLATSPNGKDEIYIWQMIGTVTKRLDVKAKERGIPMVPDMPPRILSAKRVTQSTNVRNFDFYLIRTEQFDIDVPEIMRSFRMKKFQEVRWFPYCVLVCSGPADLMSAGVARRYVFAGDKVTFADRCESHLIVCGADVKFDGDLHRSVVIARGNIEISGHIYRSHIISSKSVILKKNGANWKRDCIITENEPNPLGYIRWSDPPKDKELPKAK